MRSLLASLALLLVSCGGSSPPPEAPAPAPKAEPAAGANAGDGADDAAKRAAAVEKMTSEEATSGACDPAHQAALEKLLGDVEEGMKAKNGEDGAPLGMQVVGKKVLALGPAAKSFEMSVTGKGTDVHVMAYGAKEISMDVLVGKSAATTMRSPHARDAAKELALDVANVGKIDDVHVDSRVVAMKPGQPIVVKVTGQGCAGIVSFLQP